MSVSHMVYLTYFKPIFHFASMLFSILRKVMQDIVNDCQKSEKLAFQMCWKDIFRAFDFFVIIWRRIRKCNYLKYTSKHILNTEVYSEPCQISIMERAKCLEQFWIRFRIMCLIFLDTKNQKIANKKIGSFSKLTYLVSVNWYWKIIK